MALSSAYWNTNSGAVTHVFPNWSLGIRAYLSMWDGKSDSVSIIAHSKWARRKILICPYPTKISLT